jgi:hypothetical protein
MAGTYVNEDAVIAAVRNNPELAAGLVRDNLPSNLVTAFENLMCPPADTATEKATWRLILKMVQAMRRPVEHTAALTWIENRIAQLGG